MLKRSGREACSVRCPGPWPLVSHHRSVTVWMVPCTLVSSLLGQSKPSRLNASGLLTRGIPVSGLLIMLRKDAWLPWRIPRLRIHDTPLAHTHRAIYFPYRTCRCRVCYPHQLQQTKIEQGRIEHNEALPGTGAPAQEHQHAHERNSA